MPAIALTNDQKNSKQKGDSRQKRAGGGNQSYTQINAQYGPKKYAHSNKFALSFLLYFLLLLLGQGRALESTNT